MTDPKMGRVTDTPSNIRNKVVSKGVGANEEMQKITGGMLGGLNLPGNFKIPGM